jgi:putative sterol carrier protein
MADLTVPQVFENMKAKTAADPNKTAGINAIYQFNVTGAGGGEWYVNTKTSPVEIAQGTAPDANCIVTLADEDLVAIVSGTLNAQMAFMTGKVRIGGDMGLAMKLGKILG